MFISIFIHNSEKLETSQTSLNRWMVKKYGVHPHHGILLGNKKEGTIATRNDLDEFPDDYAECNNQSQNVIYYMILFIQHSWNDKITEMETSLVVARDERGFEGGREVGVAIKGQQVRPLWWWKCSVSWLYQDNTLAVIVYYSCTSFIKCYQGKLGKRYTGSLHYFL